MIPHQHVVFGHNEEFMSSDSETSDMKSESFHSRKAGGSAGATTLRHHYVASSVSSSMEPTEESSDDRANRISLGNLKGAKSFSATPTSSAQPSMAPEQQAADLELRRKTLEQVNRLHAQGECQPCSFFMKNSGCINGDLCRHCHLCKRKPKPRLGKNQRLRYMRMADGIVENLKATDEPTPATDSFHPFLTGLLRKRGVVVNGPGKSGAGKEPAQEDGDVGVVDEKGARTTLSL